MQGDTAPFRQIQPANPLEAAIYAWLNDVQNGVNAQYIDAQQSRRRFQTGDAFRLFQVRFGPEPGPGWRAVAAELMRLSCVAGNPLALALRPAVRRYRVELAWEGGSPADDSRAGTVSFPEVGPALRSWVERLCDWLDSTQHAVSHLLWHETPERFHPDADMRELAVVGVGQRLFPQLEASEQGLLQAYQVELAAKYKLRLKTWATIGKVAANPSPREWAHPRVDLLVISLWPLVCRHHWTYADLLKVVRRHEPGYAVPRLARNHPQSFQAPLATEPIFASHINNVLGLRKGGQAGRSARGGLPKGWQVAERLFVCEGRSPSE